MSFRHLCGVCFLASKNINKCGVRGNIFDSDTPKPSPPVMIAPAPRTTNKGLINVPHSMGIGPWQTPINFMGNAIASPPNTTPSSPRKPRFLNRRLVVMTAPTIYIGIATPISAMPVQ